MFTCISLRKNRYLDFVHVESMHVNLAKKETKEFQYSQGAQKSIMTSETKLLAILSQKKLALDTFH